MKKIYLISILILTFGLSACNYGLSQPPVVTPTLINMTAVNQQLNGENTITPTVTPSPTLTRATEGSAATAIPATNTVVPTVGFVFPPTNTPVPTEIIPAAEPVDWSSKCWAQDPDKFPGTGSESYRVYFQSIATQDNIVLVDKDGKEISAPVYKVKYQDIKNFATKNNGFVQFEGRLLTLEDTTDIFTFSGAEEGDFVYREGSFWFYTYESCPDTSEAKLLSIYTTAWGKWQGRASGNEGANLKGYKMILHDPSSYNNVGVYTLDTPFPNKREKITGSEFKVESCKNLTSPIRLDYQGEIRDGNIKNFSFGAINCNSVTVGNFADGYKAKFYRDAEDNELVANDDHLRHYIFPASWTPNQMIDWVSTNFPGITMDDPEGVTK